MKKVLSFVLLFSFVTLVYGQKNVYQQNKNVDISKIIKADDGTSIEVPAPYANPRDIEVVTLTKSGNMYSILDYHSNQVDYNARLNTVIHVHRSYGGVGTGFEYLDYSTDGGVSWTMDQNITPTANTTDAKVRYPQVAILDNGTDAKVVACGWDIPNYGVFTAIADIDGSNASSQFNALPSSGHLYSVPSDLCADANATKFYFAVLATPNGNKTDTLSIVSGDISSGTPVLTESSIDLDIQNAPVSGTTVLDFILDQGVAFSKTTPGLGYAACTAFWDGHQLPDNIGTGLHVWKTTDFGASWDLLPTFDWTSLSVINDSLVHEDGQPIRPSFGDFTLGVDANDKLHVFAEVQSCGSSAFTWFGINPSGSTTSFNNHFYDLSTTDGTSWEANYIAPLRSSTYVYFDEGASGKFYQTTYMKLAFSQDRQKEFCIWSETVGEEENSAPDMMVIGVDLITGKNTLKKNLSEATDAETASYFAFPSSSVIESGADNDYQLPIVYSEPGDNSLAELQYYYLTGAGLNTADFPVGVKDISRSNINIYPNPASDVISIDNVENVEISICNIYGSEVIKTNKTKIDISNLANGAYFVNIDDGIKVVTKKIVVLQ